MLIVALIPVLAFFSGILLTAWAFHLWYQVEKPKILHAETIRCYREFEKLLNQAFMATVTELGQVAAAAPPPEDSGLN